MKLPVVNAQGKELRSLEVDDSVFGIEPNMPLEFELELLSVTGDPVGFTLEDLPKFQPAGPPAPAPGLRSGPAGGGTGASTQP